MTPKDYRHPEEAGQILVWVRHMAHNHYRGQKQVVQQTMLTLATWANILTPISILLIRPSTIPE